MWSANAVGDTVHVFAIAQWFRVDVEERSAGRTLECRDVGIGDIFDMYGRDEMRSVAGDDEFACAYPIYELLLCSARPHKGAAFKDRPTHRFWLAGEEAQHAFHNRRWMADFAALGRLIEMRMLVEPIV